MSIGIKCPKANDIVRPYCVTVEAQGKKLANVVESGLGKCLDANDIVRVDCVTVEAQDENLNPPNQDRPSAQTWTI
jgi:hypothetical protein